MTRKRFNERQVRVMRELAAKTLAMPVIGRASTRHVLQCEAERALRGGDADLQHDGLFGDGFRQKEMFK